MVAAAGLTVVEAFTGAATVAAEVVQRQWQRGFNNDFALNQRQQDGRPVTMEKHRYSCAADAQPSLRTLIITL